MVDKWYFDLRPLRAENWRGGRNGLASDDLCRDRQGNNHGGAGLQV